MKYIVMFLTASMFFMAHLAYGHIDEHLEDNTPEDEFSTLVAVESMLYGGLESLERDLNELLREGKSDADNDADTMEGFKEALNELALDIYSSRRHPFYNLALESVQELVDELTDELQRDHESDGNIASDLAEQISDLNYIKSALASVLIQLAFPHFSVQDAGTPLDQNIKAEMAKLRMINNSIEESSGIFSEENFVAVRERQSQLQQKIVDLHRQIIISAKEKEHVTS